MPVAFAAGPAVSPMPPQKRWTRAECVELERAGLLDPDRYELIEGALVEKVSKKKRHARVLLFSRHWLLQHFNEFSVLQESAIDLRPEDNPSSEPEPDYVVPTSGLEDDGTDANPRAEEVLLAMEVSVSTLAFDLGIKANLYARAGLADYWVLDVNARRLIVHRDPAAGIYRSVIAYEAGEYIAPLAAPRASVRAADLLGAAL